MRAENGQEEGTEYRFSAFAIDKLEYGAFPGSLAPLPMPSYAACYRRVLLYIPGPGCYVVVVVVVVM